MAHMVLPWDSLDLEELRKDKEVLGMIKRKLRFTVWQEEILSVVEKGISFGETFSKCGINIISISGNIFEMQIFQPHQTSTESETLGMSPEICVLTNVPGDSDANT